MHIQPRNLFHWIKRECINTHTMNKFLLSNPTVDRRIGALPIEWIREVPKTERSYVTQQIHEAFERFSTNTAEIRGLYDYYFSGNPQDFVPEQNILLSFLKKLLNRNDISIQYIESGNVKNCSKITVGDKSYALSTFRINCTKFNSYFEKGHGRGHEPQMQFTAYARGSQGRIVKPFMGKVSSERDNGGYILSKYIEENHAEKFELSELLRSREYTLNVDTGVGSYKGTHNTINGIAIEAGGIIGNTRYISNPLMRQTWRDFANKLNSESQLLVNGVGINGKYVDMEKISDYLLQLKNRGIDLCVPDSRIILQGLPQEEQKAAIKLIRIIKKARKLKEKFIQTEEFEKYQRWLNEDIKYNFPFNEHSREYSTIYKDFTYPQLIADEFGINNIPNIEQMFNWVVGGNVRECAIKRCYTEKQIKDYLRNHYSSYDLRNDKILKYLSKELDISEEIEVLTIKNEIKSLESDLECANNSEASFFESEYSASELMDKIKNLKIRLNEMLNKSVQ